MPGVTTLAVEFNTSDAVNVMVTEDTLTVELSDGRTISVPIEWYPRLVHGTPEERNGWRIIGRGQGIHWESLDEDISVEGLLAGKPSGETQESFRKWLTKRGSAQSSDRE
ncbi:MAG: DUF2442 domain-containing protein [Gammaproteobacteria bacterium]|nr:DUF2442 domain-containing protein [Gammaproteobacteria bacterium]